MYLPGGDEHVLRALAQYYADEAMAYVVMGLIVNDINTFIDDIKDKLGVRVAANLSYHERTILHAGVTKGIFGRLDNIESYALGAYADYAAEIALCGDAKITYLHNKDVKFTVDDAKHVIIHDLSALNSKTLDAVSKAIDSLVDKIAWRVRRGVHFESCGGVDE